MGAVFAQTKGAAMGSPLGTCAANCFAIRCELETSICSRYLVYRRFCDDLTTIREKQDQKAKRTEVEQIYRGCVIKENDIRTREDGSEAMTVCGLELVSSGYFIRCTTERKAGWLQRRPASSCITAETKNATRYGELCRKKFHTTALPRSGEENQDTEHA